MTQRKNYNEFQKHYIIKYHVITKHYQQKDRTWHTVYVLEAYWQDPYIIRKDPDTKYGRKDTKEFTSKFDLEMYIEKHLRYQETWWGTTVDRLKETTIAMMKQGYLRKYIDCNSYWREVLNGS